jgi:anti-sigma B factor antagonist
MKIETRSEGGVTVLAFIGRLDTATSEDAKGTLDEVVDGGASKVLLDLEKLEYVSSAGLRILLATAKKLRTGGGELRLCALNEVVEEVFEISGFSSLLNVFGTDAQALEGF